MKKIARKKKKKKKKKRNGKLKSIKEKNQQMINRWNAKYQKLNATIDEITEEDVWRGSSKEFTTIPKLRNKNWKSREEILKERVVIKQSKVGKRNA